GRIRSKWNEAASGLSTPTLGAEVRISPEVVVAPATRVVGDRSPAPSRGRGDPWTGPPRLVAEVCLRSGERRTHESCPADGREALRVPRGWERAPRPQPGNGSSQPRCRRRPKLSPRADPP